MTMLTADYQSADNTDDGGSRNGLGTLAERNLEKERFA